MPYQFSTSAHINAPEHISELQEKLNILAAAKRSFMRNFTQLTHTMRRTLLNVYITHLRKYLTFLFSSIRSQICLTLNSFSSLISWPRILSKICESLHQDKWVALKIIANRVHNYWTEKAAMSSYHKWIFSANVFLNLYSALVKNYFICFMTRYEIKSIYGIRWPLWMLQLVWDFVWSLQWCVVKKYSCVW